MPVHALNLPAASRRPLARRLAAGLCAALLGPIAAAADVLIVIDSRHPVPAPAGVRIIELDQATRIAVEPPAHLPAPPQQTPCRVPRRLSHRGTTPQHRIWRASPECEAYRGGASAAKHPQGVAKTETG